jgi:hypothetical protein
LDPETTGLHVELVDNVFAPSMKHVDEAVATAADDRSAIFRKADLTRSGILSIFILVHSGVGVDVVKFLLGRFGLGNLPRFRARFGVGFE